MPGMNEDHIYLSIYLHNYRSQYYKRENDFQPRFLHLLSITCESGKVTYSITDKRGWPGIQTTGTNTREQGMQVPAQQPRPRPETVHPEGRWRGSLHEETEQREHRRKWRYGHDQRLKRCALRAEEGASSQEMQATSGSWKGKETDSPPKAPERLQPCQHFDFRFHTSRIVRINLCFKSLSVVIC